MNMMDKKEREALEKYAEETSKCINQLIKMIIWIIKRVLPLHEYEDFMKEFSIKKQDGE